MSVDFALLCNATDAYNFHTHTEFCDGKASMSEMARRAAQDGFRRLGFSPHGPLCLESPCNMPHDSIKSYFAEFERVRENFDEKSFTLYKGMEVDWINFDFGPHIDFFQNMGLDYTIGSVHFVPTQDGRMVDCDGRPERFKKYLYSFFKEDLRYVVERFFEQTLWMIEYGGFDILGHFDKIARNAASADPNIESYGWYKALIADVINHAAASGVAIEINTKFLEEEGRAFPKSDYWPKLIDSGATVVINSDAHHPDKIDSGRRKAIDMFRSIKENQRSLRKE